MNERTGRRRWSGDAAKRAAGWSTATPVTAQEKVESIRDLATDETVAALAACELLQRPEVAFRLWPASTLNSTSRSVSTTASIPAPWQ
ncbi:DUF6192 family protein [Streptomyces sp. BA2]|uniref:DUF6192 family protein n=1 Tax=Streptomyces sp. BA2 TaxID=436595 RepID=UPI002351B4BE|nr:DUF6192 family protein [Streptomyces sp. BA2]